MQTNKKIDEKAVLQKILEPAVNPAEEIAQTGWSHQLRGITVFNI